MDKKIRLRKEYQKLFKNFPPKEYEKIFVSLFGYETWNTALKMCKNKGKLTKVEVTKTTAFVVQKMDPEYLQAKLSYLQLTDVLLHSHKRKWYTFQLCGKGNNTIFSERGLKKEFVISTKQMNIHYEMKLQMREEIVWIRISSLTSKVDNTVYLAYFIGEGVIFSSRCIINLKLTKAIASALKFETMKKLNLEGYDVWSLLKMIKQKESKALEVTSGQRRYDNQAQNAHNSFGVDYTRQTTRRAAMENCLGSNPPVLQSLTIKSHSGLRVKRWLPEMEGFPAKVTLRFKHPNLPKYLAELAEKNIIVEPLPHYLKSFPLTGKNTICLKDASLRK